jgi:hypothetical protein
MRPRMVALRSFPIVPENAIRDYEPGIYLLALDHIAALESFLKTFLGRFFPFCFRFR